jgi:hypothetical protein
MIPLFDAYCAPLYSNVAHFSKDSCDFGCCEIVILRWEKSTSQVSQFLYSLVGNFSYRMSMNLSLHWSICLWEFIHARVVGSYDSKQITNDFPDGPYRGL